MARKNTKFDISKCNIMKTATFFLAAILSVAMSACGARDDGNIAPVPAPNMAAASPVPTAFPEPKNGEYPGKGTITKLAPRSVEINHEAIPGVNMPAMQMEFNVSNKAILSGLAVGDKIDFTLAYKDRTEIVTKIEKVK